jgi:hypothetical protein
MIGERREVDFHGKKRSNETHQPTINPETRQYKKSEGSEAYLDADLMENRNGSLVDTMVTFARTGGGTGRGRVDGFAGCGCQAGDTGGDKNHGTRELVRDKPPDVG